MSTWLFSVEPGLTGVVNMLRDERMALACREDLVPRLRLYSWNPYTLSLGHNQEEESVDRDYLRARGYGLVRRPTGGRAVFHADELTYAVAMPASGASVHQTYAEISSALKAGLERLGATEIEFSRTQPNFREHYASEDSVSCFSASALNELTWRGRKLVGSAQRRYGPVLLQHGSLLVGDAHLEIVAILHSAMPAERREILRRRLSSRTCTLDEIIPRATFEVLAGALVEGFAGHFGATMQPASDLTRSLIRAEALSE